MNTKPLPLPPAPKTFEEGARNALKLLMLGGGATGEGLAYDFRGRDVGAKDPTACTICVFGATSRAGLRYQEWIISDAFDDVLTGDADAIDWIESNPTKKERVRACRAVAKKLGVNLDEQ